MVLLLNGGADLAAVAKSGASACHWAAREGKVPAVALLLDRGADLHLKSNDGRTALHWAAEYGKLGVMALLLDRCACMSTPDDRGLTALHLAAAGGHVSAVSLLLNRGDSTSAVSNFGWTALHCAASKGCTEVVVFLLDRGAAVSARTNHRNKSVLDVATLCSKEEVSLAIRHFMSNTSQEWRPHRHMVFPQPFRSAVATVVALWCWNVDKDAPWHPESHFSVLPLEILFEIFIWMALDIANDGYPVPPYPTGGESNERASGSR